ncbi:MAG: hypothetical protein WDW36_008672 [Sanguina aurantia]
MSAPVVEAPVVRSSTTTRVLGGVASGVVYGGSALLQGVNFITPHLAGAVDIMVVQQPDGSLKSTPFYARFGKYTSLMNRDRRVLLTVNGEPTSFSMQVGGYGQAYFEVESATDPNEDADVDEQTLTGAMSPLSGYSSSGEDAPTSTGRPERLLLPLTTALSGLQQQQGVMAAAGIAGQDSTDPALAPGAADPSTGRPGNGPGNMPMPESLLQTRLSGAGLPQPVAEELQHLASALDALLPDPAHAPHIPHPHAHTHPRTHSGHSPTPAAAAAASAVAGPAHPAPPPLAPHSRSSSPEEAPPGCAAAAHEGAYRRPRPAEVKAYNEAMSAVLLSQGSIGSQGASPPSSYSLWGHLGGSPPHATASPATTAQPNLLIRHGPMTAPDPHPAFTQPSPASGCSGGGRPLVRPPSATSLLSASIHAAAAAASCPPIHPLDSALELLAASSSDSALSRLSHSSASSPASSVTPQSSPLSSPATSAPAQAPSPLAPPPGTQMDPASSLPSTPTSPAPTLEQGPSASTSPSPHQPTSHTLAASTPPTRSCDASPPPSPLPLPTHPSRAAAPVSLLSAGLAHAAAASVSPAPHSISGACAMLAAADASLPVTPTHTLSTTVSATSSAGAAAAAAADPAAHLAAPLNPCPLPETSTARSPASPVPNALRTTAHITNRPTTPPPPPFPAPPAPPLPRIELSLCGALLHRDMTYADAAACFDAHIVAADVFSSAGQAVMGDEALTVRVGGGAIYFWAVAAPLVLGMLAFGASYTGLPPLGASCWLPLHGLVAVSSSESAVPVVPSKVASSWSLWPFGTWGGSPAAAPLPTPRSAKRRSSGSNSQAAPMASSFATASSGGGAASSVSGSVPTSAAAAAAAAAPAGSHSGGAGSAGAREERPKTLTPTPQQLATLPLKVGQNTITFRVGRATELHAYIYLLPWRSKIVVSDIDGTITRSDLLGHILPAVGVDWSHPGIAKLLSDIQGNGYVVMYLSSRAITQANVTRAFINALLQGQEKLPVGPVIISPQGLLPSLYREIIVRRSHEFKIAALQEIRSLFPSGWEPFCGGFGNRDTDEKSYKAVGVPDSCIFIINPKGEIRGTPSLSSASPSLSSPPSSLCAVNSLLDTVFPPLNLTSIPSPSPSPTPVPQPEANPSPAAERASDTPVTSLPTEEWSSPSQTADGLVLPEAPGSGSRVAGSTLGAWSCSTDVLCVGEQVVSTVSTVPVGVTPQPTCHSEDVSSELGTSSGDEGGRTAAADTLASPPRSPKLGSLSVHPSPESIAARS